MTTKLQIRPHVLWLMSFLFFAVDARASGDWIDELPTVTAVAQATTAQLEVDSANWRFDLRGVSLENDDDLAAVYLVGTFVQLRKIILFKHNEEGSMSPERETKLRSIVAAYLEAELFLGQGVETRRGYLTTAQKCRDIECKRQWFKTGSSNVYISAAYRERILARLFPCDGRAAELNQLAQSYAGHTPFLPSPADVLSIPPEVVGVAPAGCVIYNGDADSNGLCDDWEKKPRTKAGGKPSASACTPIKMTQVRMAPGGGLRVTLVKDSAPLGETVGFAVWRLDEPVITGAKPLWSGDVVIQPAEGADPAPQAIVAQGIPLVPDPLHPYLLVEVTSGRSTGPVHCEQPRLNWLDRQTHPYDGLHGPYPSADRAVQGQTGDIALRLTTGWIEHGFTVVRDLRVTSGAGYYTTPPVRSSLPVVDGQSLFGIQDYGRSLDSAFDDSCEEIASFVMVALVHTHPDRFDIVPYSGGWDFDSWGQPNDNFSMEDFNVAVCYRGSGPTTCGGPQLDVRREFEKIYMLAARNRCVQSFIPEPNDRYFDKKELEDRRFPFFNDQYKKYHRRQYTGFCFPEL